MIKKINNRLEIFNYLDWIKRTPCPGDTYENILGRFLFGQYDALLGMDEENTVVALMVYYFDEKNRIFYIVLLYARGQVLNFFNEFMQLMLEMDVDIIRGQSGHDESILANIFNSVEKARKLYTVYEYKMEV